MFVLYPTSLPTPTRLHYDHLPLLTQPKLSRLTELSPLSPSLTWVYIYTPESYPDLVGSAFLRAGLALACYFCDDSTELPSPGQSRQRVSLFLLDFVVAR